MWILLQLCARDCVCPSVFDVTEAAGFTGGAAMSCNVVIDHTQRL